MTRPTFLSTNQPEDPVAALRETLELMAEPERKHGSLLARGYEYAGPHDFILRAGTWYDAPAEPHRYRQGAPKQCFGNAITAAAGHALRYVEGFASNAIIPDLAIHHAWNLEADGTVVDVTWGVYEDGWLVAPIGIAYCGIEVSVERADDATWNGDASVIDDYHRDWPLLRQPWNGEPDGLEWPPSIRLDAIRAYRDGDRATAMALYEQMDAEA